MALSKILENSITDGVISAAKLKDFAAAVDLNGVELILDADQDTSITADTDDQIDIKISGADDFRFTANTFTALSGSGIVVPDGGLTLGSTAISATAAEINLIDGGTSTGTTAVADADGIITNDGGTMRLTTAATFKTYFQEGISTAYDDLTTGDAAVNIATSAGNITIDAQGNDTDIIFKGTDGGADTTYMTIDGSAGGDLFLTGGLIDLKNDGSNVSQIKFYCESSNAHAQTLIGAPHSESATNTLTLPSTGGNSYLVTAASTATLTNKTLTTPIIAEIDSGSTITLDATTDIILDADGGDVFFKDGGTTIATLSNTSSDFVITTGVQDKDFVIKGDDNGSAITALTIDMSEAGAATFNNKIVATELDISGNVDIDGSLETDALTIGSATLAEVIQDTVGAMFSSNTETGITVTYEDGDGTIDLAVDAALGVVTSLLATDIKIGEDDQTKIDFETADEIHFYANNVEQVYLGDNIFGPQSDSDVDLGSNSVRWKDAYVDTVTSTSTITTGAGIVIADAGNIGSASDTDAIAIASNGQVTLTQTLIGTALDISGDIDIDGTTNLDVVDIDGAVDMASTLGVTGVVTANAGVVIDNITIDGTEIDLSSGDLTVDVAGDITLDADGGDFKFSDGGTQILNIANSSSDVVVKPTVDTKDLIFQQYDGTEVFRVEDGAYMSLAAMAVNPEATLTDASTISWNSLTSPVAKVTLGANRTIGAATGAVAGTFASLLVIQDGTGSRTLTWNAAYEFAADTAPTLTTTANLGDLFVFRYNGAKWLEVGRNLALTLS